MSKSQARADIEPAGPLAKLVSSLVDLGFSFYEARTYVGLIGMEPQTGYAVSKSTQVPQPKVYETLGRLAERGAVVQVSDKPAKFLAVPPARVLAQMEAEFKHRMSTAELEMVRVRTSTPEVQKFRPYWEADSWDAIAHTARKLVESSGEHLYISGHAEHLSELAPVITEADGRQVRIDVLCFGRPPFELAHGYVVQHSSTERIVYPHHQARHLAIVADNASAIWALARDGDDWHAVWAENDNLLPALVKGFVKHDMYVQRTYGDFSELLLERYGPGLEGMVNPDLMPAVRRSSVGAKLVEDGAAAPRLA